MPHAARWNSLCASHAVTSITALSSLSGLPLAIQCQSCKRRILLKPGQIGAHEDDRRLITRLPLICQCGRRDIDLFLLDAPDDARAFLSGEIPQPYEGQVDASDGGPAPRSWRRARHG